MSVTVLSMASLAGATGRGVRVAVIDSGVTAAHPHVPGVAAAVGFDRDGRQLDEAADRLGHGTAVAAAIREKAPAAELLVARVFDRELRTHDGTRWLPGALPGVVAVTLDWTLPRESCVIEWLEDGGADARASGYPRPIPGVPPEKNLKGVSFAVANVTGLLARLWTVSSEV
jgi:subtilisin family serine protease